MVTLTFAHTDEDVSYWQAEADEAHAYTMLCHDIWRSHWRRQSEINGCPDWDYLNDVNRAQAVFRVQYHLALAHREFASNHLSLVDLNS